WDENKRLTNRQKHGIDFHDCPMVFVEKVLLLPADSLVEPRFLVVGPSNGYLIAVAFTLRDDIIRIISARKARRNERRDYQDLHAGKGAQAEGRDGLGKASPDGGRRH